MITKEGIRCNPGFIKSVNFPSSKRKMTPRLSSSIFLRFVCAKYEFEFVMNTYDLSMKPMAFPNKHPMRALNDKCVPLSGTNTKNYFDLQSS